MTFFQRTKKLLSVLLLCTLLCSLAGCGNKTVQDDKTESGGIPKLKYATEGVTYIDDENALQKAVDEMMEKAKEGTIALEYKNDAVSTNGTDFSCYIANSAKNEYDMFITIYADSTLTDQLFLSELLRPGNAFESLTLERSLEPGTHRVYVFYTQVEDDWETIHAQTAVTMDFTVKES